MRIETLVADITTLEVDAVVNAAKPSLLGGGGVDGAIHRAAGPALQRHCMGAVAELPGGILGTGEVLLTPGFDLPAKVIAHTVGPIWRGGELGEQALLEDCYWNTLGQCYDAGLDSIAFPAISTGVYGYPPQGAAEIAVQTCREFERQFQPEGSLSRVLLVAFDRDTWQLYREALAGG